MYTFDESAGSNIAVASDRFLVFSITSHVLPPSLDTWAAYRPEARCTGLELPGMAVRREPISST